MRARRAVVAALSANIAGLEELRGVARPRFWFPGLPSFCVILSEAKNPGSFSVRASAHLADIRRCAEPRTRTTRWLKVLASAWHPGFFAALRMTRRVHARSPS